MRVGNEINKLRRFQRQADSIRTKLSISPPGAVIYKADLDVIGDETVVVEADGFGGAATKVVEGNYPIDYCTKFESAFATEDEAVTTAEAIVEGEIRAPSTIGREED